MTRQLVTSSLFSLKIDRLRPSSTSRMMMSFVLNLPAVAGRCGHRPLGAYPSGGNIMGLRANKLTENANPDVVCSSVCGTVQLLSTQNLRGPGAPSESVAPVITKQRRV
jgi:hypothetical protein